MEAGTPDLIKLEDLDLTAVDLKRGTRATVRPAAPE